MAPPMIGPSMLAEAKTALIQPETSPNFEAGVISGAIAMTKLYIPEPPIPWNARSTILQRVIS